MSISLEIFNLDLQNSPQKIGGWWVARLKISISLENFKILNFFKIWALRVFINCHLDPPPKPPIPPLKLVKQVSPWYYALLYIPVQGGRAFRDLQGGFGGGGQGGWKFMKTQGFRILSPGFRNLRRKTRGFRDPAVLFYYRRSELL